MNDTRGQLAINVIDFVLSSISMISEPNSTQIKTIQIQMTSHAGIGSIVNNKGTVSRHQTPINTRSRDKKMYVYIYIYIYR